jgi:hypothetical protein
VTTLNLPAGNYAIFSTQTFETHDSDSPGGPVNCRLLRNGTDIYQSGTDIDADSIDHWFSASEMGTAALASPGVILVQCQTFAGHDGIQTRDSRILAIQVTNLH